MSYTPLPLDASNPLFAINVAALPVALADIGNGSSEVGQWANSIGYIAGGDVPSFEIDPIFSAWIAGPPGLSAFTQDIGVITAADVPTYETDPVFTAWLASPPYLVAADVPANETDPVFSAWLATPPGLGIFSNDVGYLDAAALDSILRGYGLIP